MKNINIILLLATFFLLPKLQFAQTVLLKTDTVAVPCTSTDTFLVPVKVINFNNLGGLQFTMEWDVTLSKYIHIQDFNPLLLNGFVGMDTLPTNLSNGQLTFAWLDPSGLTIPNNGNNTLFNIAFVRLNGAYSPVAFDTTASPNPPPTAIAVSNANFSPVPYTLAIGGVQTIDEILPVITCPASVTVSSNSPVAISNIAPGSVSDDCGIDFTGWGSTGATTVGFMPDPNASGAVFNVGVSTVTYRTQDLGGNTATCSFTIDVQFDPSASDTLTFLASSGTANCNQVFFTDITTNNFDSIFGAQFSLQWLTSVLKFDSVGMFNAALNIQDGNFNISFTQNSNTPGNGNLSFGWNSDNFSAGTTVPDGTKLFRVYFTVTGAFGATSNIDFVNFPAALLSIDPSLSPIATNYIGGQFGVTDNILPVIQCPPSQTITAIGQQSATVTGLAPLTLTDNCAGTVALTYAPASVGSGNGVGPANGTYPGGTTVVTYTAADNAGNIASCTFTVVVDQGSVFELQIDSFAYNCGGSTSISIPFRVENFEDIAGMNFRVEWDPTVISYTGFGSVFPGMGITGASFPSASTTAPTGFLNFLSVSPAGQWPNIPDGGIVFALNFTVLNPNATTDLSFAQPLNAINGSFAPAPFQFIDGHFESVDNSAPVLTCPAPQTVPATANCAATVVLPAATATDACGTVASVVNNAPSNNLFPAGPTTVVYTATDDSGNSSTCSTTVTVNANTALQVVNCPTNPIVIQATQDCSAPLAYPLISAINPCVSNANFNYNYNNPVGTIRPVGTTTVVATATQLGNGGGFVTCTFQVEIVDAAAPVLTCPEDMTIETVDEACFVLNPTVPFPTVADNCDQNLTATIDPDFLDTLVVGQNTLIFLATDAAGNVGVCNFIVTVRDGIAPQIKCPDNVELMASANCSAVATWNPPIVSDNCTAVPDLSISGSAASGDQFITGVTTIVYEVTDISGNTTTCSFTVTVLENTPPVISNCPNNIFLLLPANKCDTIINWTAPQVTDNCGIDTFYTNIMPGTVFPAGVDTVIYTAIDYAGNITTCSFIVSALDAIAPVFTSFPNDITINNADPCGAPLNIPEPTASDNCDPDPVISYSGFLQGTFPIGVTKIEFLVKDASGNTTKDTLVVTVNALTVPSFTNIPANQTIEACFTIATWVEPLAQGFCEPPVVTFSQASGSTFQLGTTVVTYTATEASGNVITATFSITVVDTQAPVLTCPQNVVVNTAGEIISDPSGAINFVDPIDGCQGVLLNMDWPTVTDNCDLDPNLLNISGPPPAGQLTPGTYTSVFRATDESGNTSTCSLMINVQLFAIGTPSVDPNPGCEGETVVLTVPDYPGATYTWTGPQTSYPNASTITILSLSAGNAGMYSVSAALNGCTSASAPVTVVMAVKPVSNDDLDYTMNISDTLTATSVLLNDVFALPSDVVLTLQTELTGLTFNAADGTFTYINSGAAGSFSFVYELCSAACPELCDMATVTINVGDNTCDFVPNIFTPNGDGTNDFFVIPCLYSGLFRENTLVIYNQWGDKVFETKGYENTPGKAWNGTLNNEAGVELPDGVYYYIFKQDAGSKALKGFVHIYR